MIRLQLRELHFGALKKLAKVEFEMNNFIIVLILTISLIFLDDLVPEPNWPNWVIFIKNLEMMSEASIQRRKRVDKVRVRRNYGYNFLKKFNSQITTNTNYFIMIPRIGFGNFSKIPELKNPQFISWGFRKYPRDSA